MGFWARLFGSKTPAAFASRGGAVLAPVEGTVMPLREIPDVMFAEGYLGPGCGIEPAGDTIYAPFDGTVISVAQTLHAVGIASDDGCKLLIHVGMDTVEMRGESFTALVRQDAYVRAGTPLLRIDPDAIRAAGHSAVTAVIVTNAEALPGLKVTDSGQVHAGDVLMEY